MKYKIKNSDIFIDGKIISEGSEVELTPVQIQGIEFLLIPIESEDSTSKAFSETKPGHPVLVEGSNKKSKTKGSKK